MLIKVRFIGLANLILDQSIYPELLQKEARVENIVNHFTPYLNNKNLLIISWMPRMFLSIN